jgi:hypothetical protein
VEVVATASAGLYTPHQFLNRIDSKLEQVIEKTLSVPLLLHSLDGLLQKLPIGGHFPSNAVASPIKSPFAVPEPLRICRPCLILIRLARLDWQQTQLTSDTVTPATRSVLFPRPFETFCCN